MKKVKKSNNKAVYFMVYAAAIAAIYVVLTLIFLPLSFGPVQCRVAEALCILPFFTPAAIPGLFIGCLLSNLIGTAAVLDVIFGSLATLIGAIGSYALRRNRWLVCLPPILANTVIVPWVLRYAYGSSDLIPIAMVTVGIGEILSVGVFGSILLTALERSRHFIFGHLNYKA